MHCVKKGGDRQALHERIRLHSLEAAKVIKQGGENDLIARILADATFNVAEEELAGLVNAERFTGRAKEQTEEFLATVKATLEKNKDMLGIDINIKV